MNYNQNFQLVLGLVLACMIFAVSLELRWIAFRGVLKRPLGVLAGMIISNRFPGFTHKILPFFKKFSWVAFIVFLVFAIGGNWEALYKNFGFVFLIVSLHNAMALGIGYAMGNFFRQDMGEVRAITVEVGMQNSGLSLGLIPTYFQSNIEMALIAAFWGVWHAISGLILVLYWRRKDSL